METTVRRVRAFLQNKGYRVIQLTGNPIVLSGEAKGRRWDVVLAPIGMNPTEAIMLSLGRLLTIYEASKEHYEATLVLPDTEGYRAAHREMSKIVWEQLLPWVRVVFSEVRPAPEVRPAESSESQRAVPAEVRTIEEQLRMAAVGKGPAIMVRLAQQLKVLDPVAFRDQLGEAGQLLLYLGRAQNKKARRVCWEETTERWAKTLPRWVNESIRQQMMHVSSTIVPNRKTGVQRKTGSNAEGRPRTQDRAVTVSSPSGGLGQGRQRVVARPVSKAVQTVSFSSDYENLETPRPGTLFSVIDRMPPQRRR